VEGITSQYQKKRFSAASKTPTNTHTWHWLSTSPGTIIWLWLLIVHQTGRDFKRHYTRVTWLHYQNPPKSHQSPQQHISPLNHGPNPPKLTMIHKWLIYDSPNSLPNYDSTMTQIWLHYDSTLLFSQMTHIWLRNDSTSIAPSKVYKGRAKNL